MSEGNTAADKGPILPGPGGMMRGGGGPGAMIGKASKAKDAKGTARRLWGYLKGYRAALAAVVIFVAATAGIGLLGPYLLGRAIDRYAVSYTHLTLPTN